MERSRASFCVPRGRRMAPSWCIFFVTSILRATAVFRGALKRKEKIPIHWTPPFRNVCLLVCATMVSVSQTAASMAGREGKKHRFRLVEQGRFFFGPPPPPSGHGIQSREAIVELRSQSEMAPSKIN